MWPLEAAAERMAFSLGEKVGQTVGYRIRLDNCVSDKTRIEVITEGILTRVLQDDPSLAGIGLVIFDEFHERSLDADFGLALALQGRSLFREPREPLKILVMSATLDGERVGAAYGRCPDSHQRREELSGCRSLRQTDYPQRIHNRAHCKYHLPGAGR